MRNSLGEDELFFFPSVKAASGAQFPFLSPFGPWPKKWENCSACLRVKKIEFRDKAKKTSLWGQGLNFLRKYINRILALTSIIAKNSRCYVFFQKKFTLQLFFRSEIVRVKKIEFVSFLSFLTPPPSQKVDSPEQRTPVSNFALPQQHLSLTSHILRNIVREFFFKKRGGRNFQRSRRIISGKLEHACFKVGKGESFFVWGLPPPPPSSLSDVFSRRRRCNKEGKMHASTHTLPKKGKKGTLNHN